MSQNPPSILLADLRPVETKWAIHALKQYMEISEAQIEEAFRLQLSTLEIESKPGNQEEYDFYCEMRTHQEDVFEADLLPALRYSHVILLHILVETKLRAFCKALKNERKVPDVLPTDFKGGPLDQVNLFLSKFVGIAPQSLPEWGRLKTLQKVRDCIVHTYGNVSESKDDAFLHRVAKDGVGISVDSSGKLIVEKVFCTQYLEHTARFFNGLFLQAGWGAS